MLYSLCCAVVVAASLAVPVHAAATPQPTAPPETSQYYYVLSRHLEGEGRAEEAVAALKKAIELDPQSADLYAELAGMYARQDKALEALDSAEVALKRDPGNQDANLILGTVYAAFAERRMTVRKGEDPSTYPAKAIAALEKAAGDRSDLGLDLMLGRLYLQTGAFDKASEVLEEVVDERPDFVEGVVLLSTAQEGAGNVDQAIATLQAFLHASPESYRVQVRVAELYERAERWGDAADAYAQAQKLNPRAQQMLVTRRAVALLSAGRAADAKTIVQSSLGANPDPVLLYLLAESQRALKELDAALATAQKLVAGHPDDARGFHVLSLIQQDKGDLNAAEKTLRELIARDPIDADALNSLGYMLAERGDRLDEAVSFVERALKIEPDNPSYLDSLGWAYFQQGRLELADTHLTQAAEKLKSNSVVQDHLGDLRFKQKRYSDAAAAWQRALSGDGQSIDRPKIEKKLRDARGRM
jgi:tetratricopeptide (TPR) repeat protein